MSEKLSPLARCWRWLFSRRPAPEAARPVRLTAEHSPRPLRGAEERRSGIEPLEGRIAPAALLAGGKDVSYTDSDGDKVTIHLSTPIFAGLTGPALNSALDKVFVFSAADTAHTGLVPQQLQRIDLTLAPAASGISKALGLSLAVQVTTPAPGSDGHANVGAIEATGLTLGTVSVQGDLGHLVVGSNGSAVAVQALSALTLGQVKTSQTGTPSYTTSITGAAGSITLGSITDALLQTVNGAKVNNQVIAVGNIGTLTIGSAAAPNADVLIGGTAVDSATVIAAGNIGAIQVYGNLHGSDGGKSAAISCGGNMSSVLVTGRLIGGGGDNSATIQAGGAIGAITVGSGGGNALQGGTGTSTAAILSGGNLGTVVIKGSILGGGQQSGRVESDASLGYLTVLGDVVGGAGAQSGLIGAGAIGSVNITGQLRGGVGSTSGEVAAAFGGAGNIATVAIGQGMIGGDGEVSGSVNVTGSITSITVGANPATGAAMQGGKGEGSAVIDANGTIYSVLLKGNLLGIGDTTDATTHLPNGDGDQSAGISAGFYLGNVRVLGSVIGSPTATHSGYLEGELGIGSIGVSGNLEGGGVHSGVIASGGSITGVNVGGHVQGGASAYSGTIVSGYGGSGTLGTVIVSGGLVGGAGANSGSISSGSALGAVRISLPAGSAAAALQGGGGSYSGSVYAAGGLGSIGLAGSMAGAGGDHSGSIEAHGGLGGVSVTSISGGGGDYSGSVIADDYLAGSVVQLANLAVLRTGVITGGSGAYSGSLLSDSAIGTVTATELARGSGATGATIATGLGVFGTGNAQALNLAHFGRNGGSVGGTLEIHGGLVALTTTEIVEGTIHANAIGTITTGLLNSSTITALGHPENTTGTDLALARLIVTGNVTNSNILAGYDLDGTASSGQAQIGSVTVQGSWSASNLIAGVSGQAGYSFGAAGDAALPVISGSKIISSIASVVIRGTLSGGATAQTYAFEAERIGSFQYGAKQLPLTAAPGEQFSSEAPHVVIREVAIPASA